jgi:Uma2 family endonuclease
MAVYPIRTRRWTRAEYDQMIADGRFRPDERLELLGGQLVVREPQGSRHSAAIELALEALQRAFGSPWRVRVQLPVALDPESEPEPDLCVVAGDPRTRARDHPPNPVLIVEVADSSVAFDREHKGSLYARAGIADYWIVNVEDSCLEVCRRPVRAPDSPFRWRYAERSVLGAADLVSPLAAPSARIQVNELLP